MDQLFWMDVGYTMMSEDCSKAGAIAVVLVERFLGWICARLGHGELIDEGYGTPESGCIHVVCLRCGATLVHEVLY